MSIYTEVLASISAQRSKGWHDVRVGRFTASEIWKLFVEPRNKAAKEAGELGETAKTYIKTKVAETLTGVQHRAYSAAINWGEENEENGLLLFMEKTGIKIKSSAFVPYGDHAGGTPDADCTEESAIVELKCPFDSSNMIDYLRLRKIEIDSFFIVSRVSFISMLNDSSSDAVKDRCRKFANTRLLITAGFTTYAITQF